ncbi:MAG: MFS transporter [Rhodospirillales bacterium]|nr:MFS transporter [Rhodospirillales bacterium]
MASSINIGGMFGGISRALSHREYRRFFIANFLSTIGRWMYRMSVGWLTWELTKSTSWLGIVAFSEIFPTLLLSFFAGAIADRIGYGRVMRACQFLTTFVGILFATLVLHGSITIELILALTICYGSLEALSTPARMSVVHAMVPLEDLSAAVALGSTSFNAARFLGPAIAGLLITYLSTGLVMSVCAVMFFQFYIVLIFLRINESGRDRKMSFELCGDMKQGLIYVWGHHGIRFLMLLLGVTGLLIRPFMELLPGFSDQVFGRGPEGMSILLSSIGLGAVFSGLWLAQRGETRGLTHLVTVSMMICAVALLAFSMTGYLWLGAAFLFVLGCFMLLAGIGSQTLIQNVVDSSMRARVLSLFVLISWGLPALGAVAMGWLAEFVGLQEVVGGGAVLTLGVWLWARRVTPSMAAGLEKPVQHGRG